MASQGELAATGGVLSPTFSQSGQLDWVALSRTPVTYTLEVAARLSKAGIDTGTVMFGSTLGSMFSFSPDGQNELFKSLSGLKGQSSFSKALWFGFGIQHVVRDFTRTEGGAACVAISAALTVIYTPFQSAQVWRSMCQLTGAPTSLTPSVHQWTELMDVCAGSLAKSKFMLHYRFFGQLLSTSNAVPDLPADSESVARALHILASLSQGSLVNAIFRGFGNDCAWLATVAFYLFKLRIEIQDEEGHVLHVSQTTATRHYPQAIFQRGSSSEAPKSTQQALVGRTCQITSGEQLLHHVESVFQATQPASSWDTIFEDNFPSWTAFHDEPLRLCIVELIVGLCKISILSTWKQSWDISSEEHFVASALNTSEQTRTKTSCFSLYTGPVGIELLNIARRLFPKLRIPVLTQLCAEDKDHLTMPDVTLTWQAIHSECGCHKCKPEPDNLNGVCHKGLALTALRWLVYLAPVEVDTISSPSSIALRTLETDTRGDHDGPMHDVFLDPLRRVLFLLTGRTPYKNRNMTTESCAVSAGGVCVFYLYLEDLSIFQPGAVSMKAMPGHIRHEQQSFEVLQDPPPPDIESTPLHPSQWLLPEFGDELLRLNADEYMLVLREHELRPVGEVWYMPKFANSSETTIWIGRGHRSLSVSQIDNSFLWQSVCLRPCKKALNLGRAGLDVSLDDPMMHQLPRCRFVSGNKWMLATCSEYTVTPTPKEIEVGLYDVSNVALLGMMSNLQSNHFDHIQLFHGTMRCTKCILQFVIAANILYHGRNSVLSSVGTSKGVLRHLHYCTTCERQEIDIKFTATIYEIPSSQGSDETNSFATEI